MSPSTAPWVALGTKLGTLLLKLLKKQPTRITLVLRGGAIKDYKAFLSSAVLLGCMSGEGVNLVSVRSAAREAGVEVKVTCEEVEGCSLLTVESEGVRVGGTVQDSAALLTSINGSSVGFFQLTGSVLLFTTTALSVSDVVAMTTDTQQVQTVYIPMTVYSCMTLCNMS